MKFFICLFLLISLSYSSYAQSSGKTITPYQLIFDRPSGSVYIQYLLFPCASSGTCRYGFKSTFQLKGATLTGMIHYQVCEGNIKTENFTVNLDKPGEVHDDGAWINRANRIIDIDHIELHDPEADERKRQADEQKQQDKQKQIDEQKQAEAEKQAETDRQLDAKRQQYQNLSNQAQASESAGDLTQARSQYQQALDTAPTESEQSIARSRIAALDQAIAQKAETERQNRVVSQNKENQQEAQNLLTDQSDDTDAFLLIAFALVMLLFDNLNENGPHNQYIKPSIRLSGHLGYSFQSYPAYFNSAESVYNGTTSRNTISTGSGQVNTPNIEGGGEFWPFYSRVFGAGVFTNGNFGLWFRDKNYGLESGFKAFIGHPNIQLIGEYRYGYRHFEHHDEIAGNGGTTSAATNITTATANYNFLRVGAGLRINWNSNWGDVTRSHLDLMYLQESFPQSTILTDKRNGFSTMLWFDDRLCFYGTYFPDYYRTGAITGGKFTADINGSLLRIGFFRTFDFFGGKQ